MKKWILMLLLAGSIQGAYAQKTEKKEKFNPNTPLFEELICKNGRSGAKNALCDGRENRDQPCAQTGQ